MCEAILFRNISDESEEVNRILKKTSLKYAEVFSLQKGEKPTLVINKSLYYPKGYDNILAYLYSRRLIKKSA